MTTSEYHQLLKFLYFEGYADSYEEAEYIIEEMNDEDFEALCEEVFPQFTQEELEILEYLMNEGYASDDQSALVILENMSDEWRESIVEAKYGTPSGRKELAKKIRKGKEIGKSGPGTGFKEVEKQAKKYGARDPKAVAAAAMWKHYGK